MNRQMIRFFPIVAGALLLVGYGIVEGAWTNRWENTVNWNGATATLGDVPMVLKNWTGHDLKLTDRERVIGQIQAYWYRRYVQQGTGKTMTVLVVCGRPGPIAAHSPEVCFAGAGYTEVGTAYRRSAPSSFENGAGEFWTASFRKGDAPLPDPLRVTLSWNATGQWQAPSQPRWSFARYPILFKLYLVQSLNRLDAPDAKQTEDEFMSLLLPELHSRLISSN
jgi:hypothetical protein